MHEGLDPASAARDQGAVWLTQVPSPLVAAAASTKQQRVLEVKKDRKKDRRSGQVKSPGLVPAPCEHLL